jgi:hypothetical protein
MQAARFSGRMQSRIVQQCDRASMARAGLAVNVSLVIVGGVGTDEGGDGVQV